MNWVLGDSTGPSGSQAEPLRGPAQPCLRGEAVPPRGQSHLWPLIAPQLGPSGDSPELLNTKSGESVQDGVTAQVNSL